MKKIITIFIISCMIVSIFGCRKTSNKEAKKEEPAVKTYTEDEYYSLQSELNQLENEIAIYDNRYKTLKAFQKKNVVQSGIWSFNKISDKIVLEATSSFEKVGAIKPIGLMSSIVLGEDFSLKADSWQIQTNTSELSLCIPNHAYGRISLYSYDDTDFFPEAVIYDYIRPYFDENSITPKDNGRKLYVNNEFIGEELSGNVSIIDSTTNGMQLSVPASQILEEDLLSSYKLSKDSNININLDLDVGKEIDANYRVGIGNSRGLVIYYEFLTLDNSGKINTDDLLSSIQIRKSPLYLR